MECLSADNVFVTDDWEGIFVILRTVSDNLGPSVLHQHVGQRSSILQVKCAEFHHEQDVLGQII